MKKKVEENKLQKKNALFQSSFDLFVNHGFSKTTIADIVKKAGLAKGTFYLYFKDKYDLRDKLITHITGQLFEDAHQELTREDLHSDFDAALLKACDYFIRRFEEDPRLLGFITKNLSWGIFRSALEKDVPDEDVPFYRYYTELMDRFSVRCRQPELMLFTIIELLSSSCYSCILYQQPVSMEEYKPYLHRSILAILHAYTE
ncbi:MAG: TetR/AcrR family transcriptional regulator [Eubacterium sp.]|nr:TetR/AcrR family transcriptional regulator [Eubacterium sp.]